MQCSCAYLYVDQTVNKNDTSNLLQNQNEREIRNTTAGMILTLVFKIFSHALFVFVFVFFCVWSETQSSRMSEEWKANECISLNRATGVKAKNHSSNSLLNWSAGSPASPDKPAFSGSQATSHQSFMTNQESASGVTAQQYCKEDDDF